MQLTPEETLLLHTCRPYLSRDTDEHVRRLAASTLDWNLVLWRAETFRTVPLLHYHLRRTGALDHVPEPARTYLDAWTSLSAARSEALFQELGAIIDAFTRDGVEFFLMKGTAVSLLLTPNRLVRPMLDLDIMVNPADVDLARKAMTGLGYTHSLWNADTDKTTRVPDEQLAEIQAEHYELPAFMKRVYRPSPVPREIIPAKWRRKHLKCHVDANQRASFPVFVDLHLNVSFDIDLHDVWRGVTAQTVLGRKALVQSYTGMLWFFASRLYHEAFQLNSTKLLMFGDLHSVLHRKASEIDWDEMLRVAERYGLQPSLFYVLSQLQRITGAPVPDAFLDRMRPDPLGVPHSHDWGDVMPKLFTKPILHDITLS